jgi:hypothetical protein
MRSLVRVTWPRSTARLGVARLGVAGLLATVLLSCQACSPGPEVLTAPAGQIMLVKASVLEAVLVRSDHLAHTFGGRVVYVTTPAPATSQAEIPRLAGAVQPTYIYKSFAAFAADVAAGRLPGSIRAVMYDIEKWAGTPVAEQRDPRAYMLRFTALAREHGLLPILAPARDLALVPGGTCAKRPGENLSQAYLRCGLAGAVRHAAALIVQGQVNEFDVTAYRRFIAAAAAQARASDPHVAVLAQLATAPLGQPATAAQLVAAARSVARLVQGFSLTARPGDVQTSAELLGALRPSGGQPTP